MMPIDEDLCTSGTQQPLLFINTKRHVLDRVNNLKIMLKTVKPPNESGISTCRILTLKYVAKVIILSSSILIVV